VTDRITAGEKRAILVRWEALAAEGRSDWANLLPPLTVVRKAKALDTAQTEQLNKNRAAQQVELGLIPADSLRAPKSTRPVGGPVKPPRLGAEGCCGLGCNGCLPFWNDEKYERPRARLLESRRGKLIERTAEESRASRERHSATSRSTSPDVAVK
jgi:putative protease